MFPPSLPVLLLVIAAAGAQGNDTSCARCHPGEARTQPQTSMARALSLNDAKTGSPRPLTATLGSFTYSVEVHDGKRIYRVSDGAHNLTLPIHSTFGAGAQTYVLFRDGAFFESMVSYYPETGNLDVTVGDQSLHPQTLDEAVGRKLESKEIESCFGCHSTNSAANGKFDLAHLTPGVTCQRCHASATAHANSMAHPNGLKQSKPVIPEKLGHRSAESISNFCGQCHRSWETVVRNNWKGESNVRFQPYRLANSQCFDGADRRIGCLACHNPHQELVRKDNAYDAKCLACHTAEHGSPAVNATLAAKHCPVAKTDCVSCHMPKVPLPGGHQTFTDHNIRVVKANEKYPD